MRQLDHVWTVEQKIFVSSDLALIFLRIVIGTTAERVFLRILYSVFCKCPHAGKHVYIHSHDFLSFPPIPFSHTNFSFERMLVYVF